jgi:hypothetical protein
VGIHQNSCDACLLPATMRCDAKPADREHRRHIPLGRTHRRNFSARAKSTIMTNANSTLYLCVRACAPKRSSAREEQLASLCLRACVRLRRRSCCCDAETRGCRTGIVGAWAEF